LKIDFKKITGSELSFGKFTIEKK